jgi:hypothetical protein
MILSKILTIIFGRGNDILWLMMLNFSFEDENKIKIFIFYFIDSTIKHFSLIIEKK